MGMGLVVDAVDDAQGGPPVSEIIELPAPTAWPVVLAFGVTLIFAGLVTSAALSLLGLPSAVTGMLGWFREVFPHEAHVSVRVLQEETAAFTKRRNVARLQAGGESSR
jgi:hypothetical protein